MVLKSAKRNRLWGSSNCRLRVETLEDRLVLSTIHVPANQPTISAAIAVSTAGDTIKVAAGDYRGEGVIAVGKTLNIIGVQDNVDPTKGGRTPAGPDEATVTGFDLRADKIEIEGFTITNVGGDGIVTASNKSGYEIEYNIFSGNQRAGILLTSNGTLRTDIEHNWWNNAVPEANGPQIAQQAEGDLGPDMWDIRNFGSDGPLSNVNIEKNKFSQPSLNGSAIDLEGSPQAPHSKIDIERNLFEHSNGVLLSNVTDSEVTVNTMMYYTGSASDPADGVGINVQFFLNNVEVNKNNLYAGKQSGDAIRIQNATGPASKSANVEVEDNIISGGVAVVPGGNGADGIHVQNDGVATPVGFMIEIKRNAITHMGHDGIRLDGVNGGVVSGVLVRNNDISFCQFDGIDLESANGNTVRDNTSSNNGDNGIRLVDSSNNVVKINETRNNASFGIRVAASSPGLAKDNIFERNVSFDNGIADYRDSTDGVQTALTANTWTKNKGAAASPGGLIN